MGKERSNYTLLYDVEISSQYSRPENTAIHITNSKGWIAVPVVAGCAILVIMLGIGFGTVSPNQMTTYLLSKCKVSCVLRKGRCELELKQLQEIELSTELHNVS